MFMKGRMKMKKTLSLILAALLTVTLASCSADKDESSSAGTSGAGESSQAENVTLKLYNATDTEELTNKQIEAFNALDNGITVEASLIPNDDYDDKMKVLISGGATILTSSGFASLPRLISIAPTATRW